MANPRSGSPSRPLEPPPLPPPGLTLSESTLALLSDASVALGRLDGSVATLPNADLFVLMYIRKEAVYSSQIEGTQSSLDDLLAAEAKILDPDRPRDVEEVIDYVAALRLGLERLEELPISVRLLREIHARLLQSARGANKDPGEFRRIQNWIGPAGCSIADATFVPPPPQRVPDLMADLERFLHAESSLPPLIRIGLAHAQLETIHPFLDGNGRLGRLLITLMLCEQGILGQPVLYLSHHLRIHRSEYYDRLQATRGSEAWAAWLEFFLGGVASAATDAAETASRILELRERHRDLLMQHLGRGAANAVRVLDSLYSLPITTVKSVRELLDVTSAGANTIVARLVDLGILREITGHARNRKFEYEAYVRLFGEG